jgi:hypothetical protein
MAITKKATTYTLSLDIPTEIKGEDRDSLLADLSEYLLSEVIAQVESGHSPVKGQGDFKPLNKAYANAQKNGDTVSNLDLHGDMLGALTAEAVGRSKIKIGITGDQALKSYAHNTGFKGHKKLGKKGLRRAFIPNTNEIFDKSITKGLNELIAEKLSEVLDNG